MCRTLLGGLDSDRYLLGREMSSFSSYRDCVRVRFSDGSEVRADLLVGADGISSSARRMLLPEVSPCYAGYVAWRGVVPGADLSASFCQVLHDALTYQLLPNSHILVYPIPGLDGAVERGHRLMNMVWDCSVSQQELPAFLTDRTGQQPSVSLPPGTARDEVVRAMRQFAAEHLAAPIAEVVTSVGDPFVQAVFDIDVPRMVDGRACLVGTPPSSYAPMPQPAQRRRPRTVGCSLRSWRRRRATCRRPSRPGRRGSWHWAHICSTEPGRPATARSSLAASSPVTLD
jgi:2,6-dihydroxypyridine 3-monooxygenase